MRQLHLIAHGEPSDVIQLNTVSAPTLGQEEVVISMEAAPLKSNRSGKILFKFGVTDGAPGHSALRLDIGAAPRHNEPTCVSHFEEGV
jgi:hypothetical protein